MNRVFLDLSPEEAAAVERAFSEEEQGPWVIEKTDQQCQLCGYFDGNFQEFWQLLQTRIPLLAAKTLAREELPAREWQEEYKRFLKPFQLGCLHVVPAWERLSYPVPDGQFAVYLDAEMAFGTGAHETTKLCLARIVDYRNLFKSTLFLKKMIDVGCGSGILSIAAAKLGFGRVYGFDNDPEAVKISEKNARENGVSTIEFSVAGISAGILGYQADLVVANILAPVLIAHASLLVNTVKRYGILSLSGILDGEVEAVKTAFTPLVERHWDGSISNTKTMGQWSEIAYIRT
ncbi:MAG: 50S ribosomal protein L11 methyltransferase [Puniceicoccales bacterium]|nr:50S ribosomal protein L11 methyltransferase [Puniceicoccales bacterium]